MATKNIISKETNKRIKKLDGILQLIFGLQKKKIIF